MIPQGVETLDDIAVGITYNKEPYTTNNRFSVVTPDLPSQHKFFTVDNYTHWYLKKYNYPIRGSATERDWTGRYGTLAPINEQAQRPTQTMPVRRAEDNAAAKDGQNAAQGGDRGYARYGGEGQYGAKAGGSGDGADKKVGFSTEQPGWSKYGNTGEISPEKFAGQSVRAFGPLSKRCVACQMQGPPLKTFCMTHRSPRKSGIQFMRVLKVPGVGIIKLAKKRYQNTMYEGFAGNQ
eukprot:TRINITY_DN6794_c0_g1_i7.p1 TRINITY_DN6794_c0_g1~~TRINITY_DN6794_c0_g1_i7.p1  ORF type:complete len:236 (-),score=42.85 TRINITY_DN6794_c0_g1_i7:161-868(-)